MNYPRIIKILFENIKIGGFLKILYNLIYFFYLGFSVDLTSTLSGGMPAFQSSLSPVDIGSFRFFSHRPDYTTLPYFMQNNFLFISIVRYNMLYLIISYDRKGGNMKSAEQYKKFEEVYEYFNQELFDGQLQGAFILLTRSATAEGHFGSNRFKGKDSGENADEISLNPDFFFNEEGVMQTLVHEMSHQWQFRCGEISTRCYHDRQWSEKMQEIGLMPSSTGRPGGNKTGQNMSDYIIEGGRFERLFKKLQENENIIDWISSVHEVKNYVEILGHEDGILKLDEEVPGLKPGDKIATRTNVFEVVEIGEDGNIKVDLLKGDGVVEPGEQAIIRTRKKKNKIKYSCSKCGINVWGKPDLKILCIECEKLLLPC